MFCPVCQEELPDGATQCPKDGTIVSAEKSRSTIAFAQTSIQPAPEKSSRLDQHIKTAELPVFSADLPLFDSEEAEMLGENSTMVQSIPDELELPSVDLKLLAREETRVQGAPAPITSEPTFVGKSPDESTHIGATPRPITLPKNPSGEFSSPIESTHIGATPQPILLPQEGSFRDEPTRIGATPRPIELPRSEEPSFRDEPTRIGATPRPIELPKNEDASFREEPTRIGATPKPIEVPKADSFREEPTRIGPQPAPKVSEFTSEPTAIHAAPPPQPTKRRRRRQDQFQDEKTNVHRGAVEIELGPGVQLGDYEIESYVGAGGMGEIWKATDTTTQRKVAIKVLLEELLDNDVLVARFFQEARTINELKHPNIVEIFSFSELPDGRPYFVMEFLEGKTLAQYIKDHGPLPFREIASIIKQLCEALQAAHNRSIVHRDLKPENIYLLHEDTNDLLVKVLDFGVAKLLSQEARGLTHSGAFIGTPAYVSPEQCAGSQQLDHRADIYAVGIILFEMITGRTPFEEPNEANALVMVKQMSNKAPPPSSMVKDREVPATVDQLVCSMLEKDPEDRPQRCADLPAIFNKALKEKRDESWESLGAPVPIYALGVGEQRKKPNKILEPSAPRVRSAVLAWLPFELPPHLQRFVLPISAAILLLLILLVVGYLWGEDPPVLPQESTTKATSLNAPAMSIPAQSAPAMSAPVVSPKTASVEAPPKKEQRPEDPKEPKNKKEEPKSKEKELMSAKEYAKVVDTTIQRADFSSCAVLGTGVVLVRLTINAKGKAIKAITNTTPLGGCVSSVLKKTKFPASGSEQSFSPRIHVK